jgi:hypothetical protein
MIVFIYFFFSKFIQCLIMVVCNQNTHGALLQNHKNLKFSVKSQNLINF